MKTSHEQPEPLFLTSLVSNYLMHSLICMLAVCSTPLRVNEELLLTTWNYVHHKWLPRRGLGAFLLWESLNWPKQKTPQYSLTLGAASSKLNFCNIFCSLHDIHMQCISFFVNLHTLHVQFMQRTEDNAKVRFSWGISEMVV